MRVPEGAHHLCIAGLLTQQSKWIRPHSYVLKLLRQVQREMEEFRAEGRMQEAKRHSHMRDFEAKLHEAESQAQAFESQATAVSKVLDQLKSGTHT